MKLHLLTSVLSWISRNRLPTLIGPVYVAKCRSSWNIRLFKRHYVTGTIYGWRIGFELLNFYLIQEVVGFLPMMSLISVGFIRRVSLIWQLKTQPTVIMCT